MMNLDKVILENRESLKLTKKQFGDMVGVSPVCVLYWETGTSVRSTYIPAICKAFNLTPNQLFSWS